MKTFVPPGAKWQYRHVTPPGSEPLQKIMELITHRGHYFAKFRAKWEVSWFKRIENKLPSGKLG
jgi:hypothetical protein